MRATLYFRIEDLPEADRVMAENAFRDKPGFLKLSRGVSLGIDHRCGLLTSHLSNPDPQVIKHILGDDLQLFRIELEDSIDVVPDSRVPIPFIPTQGEYPQGGSFGKVTSYHQGPGFEGDTWHTVVKIMVQGNNPQSAIDLLQKIRTDKVKPKTSYMPPTSKAAGSDDEEADR